MKLILVVLVVLSSYRTLAEVRYDGYGVYDIIPRNLKAVQELYELEHNSTSFNFWTPVRGINIPVQIMVPNFLESRFNNLIRRLEIDAKLMIPDVQALIDSQKPKRQPKAAFDWTSYHTLAEINAWLQGLADENPELVTVITAGKSYEERDILGVRVSYNASNQNNAIFLEGNIHAREWISSATVTYILNELLTSTDPRVRALAESHDWYIVPVFNPDGFEYTHTTDRMWRKTRVPYLFGLCYGADPNRNWGYHWNDGGASDIACSETYAGPNAFSEPETASIAEYIQTIGERLVGYVGFHSYSQLLLIPYGHSPAHVENYEQLYRIGLDAASSLAKRYNTQYTVGNIVETIYVASGGSMDWVKGTFHTPVTYTYELRDTGRYGFILPPEQIIPTAEETLDSLLTIFEEYDNEIKNKKH